MLSPIENEVAGKTGVFDESILVNDPRLWKALARLRRNRLPKQDLWDFPVEYELHVWKQTIAQLGIDQLQPCRYAMRHGGASADLTTKARTVEAVKRRGRWRSDASLRRYAKESRVLSQLAKVDSSVLRLGESVEEKLEDLLLGVWTPRLVGRRLIGAASVSRQ